jgi:hypothetical protein
MMPQWGPDLKAKIREIQSQLYERDQAAQIDAREDFWSFHFVLFPFLLS